MKQHWKGKMAAVMAAVMLLSSACSSQRQVEPDSSADTSPGFFESLFGKKEEEGSVQNVTAQQESDTGIPTDTSFLLTVEGGLSQEMVRQCLNITPPFDYTLDKEGEGWKLTPDQPMQAGTVYAFGLLDTQGQQVNSCAFQTTSELMVSSTYPRDTATYVSTNTGVELNFNQPVGEMADYFHIEPEVSGKLTAEGYRLTFVPDSPLEGNQIYTVTIGKGAPAQNGSTLAEDYTFRFQVYDKYVNRMSLYRNFTEMFVPGDQLVVELSTGNYDKGSDVTTTIYRFEDGAEYEKAVWDVQKQSWQMYSFGTEQVDYDSYRMQQVTSFTAPLFQREYSGRAYDILPENMEEGYYLVKIEGSDNTIHKFIQISNTTVYSQAFDGSVTLWLNDAASSQPCKGLRTVITDPLTGESVEGTTDQDGLVTLETGEMEEVYLKVYDGQTLTAFQELRLTQPQEENLSEQFYAALYTDRTVYRATDTLEVWGRLQPRRSEFALPKTVELVLTKSWGSNDLYSQTVTVDEQGYFEGKLSFTGLEKDSYVLYVRDQQGKEYCSQWLQVENFQKPAYFVEVSPEKDYYYLDETIVLNLSASYYDGTPVSGGELLVSCYECGLSGEPVTLDENGKARLETKMLDAKTQQESYSEYRRDWEPEYAYFTITTSGLDNVSTQKSIEVPVMPSRTAVSTQSTDGTDLQIALNSFDAQKVADGTPISQSLLDAVDQSLEIEIWHGWWERTVKDSYYDQINKKTVYEYNFDYQTELLGTQKVQTTDGKLHLTDLAPAERVNESYYCIIRFDGGCGETVSDSVYLVNYNDWEAYDNTYYSFERVVDSWDYTQPTYEIGDQIELSLHYQGDQVAQKNNGRVLYSLVQDRVLLTDIFTSDQKQLEMKEEYLPNMTICGAYFDGRHIYSIRQMQIAFDYQARRLNLDISTDQQQYAPGQTLTAQVAVTDQSGQPVPEARVCLGVVDEAIFAVQDQQVRLLEQLYEEVYSPDIAQQASYIHYDLEGWEGGGGRGGGDGEALGAIRDEFLDTALFQQQTCDKNGKASFTIQLPDNITEWRITAAAMADTLLAGDNTSSTIATLPFYLQPLVTSRYLEGDDLSVNVSFNGQNLSSTDTADCTVTLYDAQNQPVDTKTVSLTWGKQTNINFGKQPVGEYTLLFEGNRGDDSDRVSLPVSVAAAGVELVTTQNLSVEELSALDSARYPVNILFYDEQRKLYMDTLDWLLSESGERFEIIAANNQARVLYNELLPSDQQLPLSKDERLGLNNDGARILPAAAPDAELNAKLQLVDPSLATNDDEFYYIQLADESVSMDEKVMSYVGLAARGQAMLLPIRQLLQNEEITLTAKQTLWLGAALAKMGDYDGAKQAAASLGDVFVTEGDTRFYRSDDKNEQAQTTAAALVLYSLVGDNETADALMRWMLQWADERTSETSVVPHLEIVVYLQSYRQRLGIDKEEEPSQQKGAAITYTRDGKQQTEYLGPTGCLAMQLSFEQMQEANFQTDTDKVYANVRSYQLTQPQSSYQPPVTIEKICTPAQNSTVGELVKVQLVVTFADDAPQGCYQITDSIPSGMRYIYGCTPYEMRDTEQNVFVLDNEEQQLSGYLYRYTSRDGTAPANRFVAQYYVNPVLAGEFLSQPASVTFPSENITAVSSSGNVQITP